MFQTLYFNSTRGLLSFKAQNITMQKIFSLIAVLGLVCSCNSSGPNILTAEEQKDGWELLFDGKTTNGWHLYNMGNAPSVWEVKNGTLVCNPNGHKLEEHGDLVSDKEFENFDLKFEWQITEGGNSGVFINVLERPDIMKAWGSGPEYQLLDNAHPDFPNPAKRSGCLFGFGPQKNPAANKPKGEWNESEIKQENGKISFYLNGVLTVEKDLTSTAWLDSLATSNFKTMPEYGKHTKGRIALQEWKGGASFRNVKIRKL